METMISVWTMVEHVRVASGAAELAIFTAIIYWFFTSSRVADMLEVVGERVGGWCGRDTSSSLRQAVRARRRPHHQEIYTKIDADNASRTAALYKLKESPSVPAPVPQTRPPAGLACVRCAPLSRESWQDPNSTDTGAVINILDIGRQNFANGGVVSRYLCDIAQCCKLVNYDYKDVVPNVVKDESVQRAIEDTTQQELTKLNQGHEGSGDASVQYSVVKKRVEARALKVIQDISSAMSTNVLKFVAWVCHKSIRRVASGGCSTRAASIERLRRANAAGLPLVFVPLHRSHFDYILVTFVLYLTGLRPPLVAAGDNMRIPFFGWFLRGCGAFYIRRRVEGSDYHGDPVYKSALRAYILNSLAARNNLEFFIEGGRTRTGKPQTPKAGILSVILDAYIDGTIDDALLVPVTLNYDKLVDGNFVREQLGMPKQMETFWSALRGIWWTLNTDHGSIRVDFNQPISLKELVTSFQKYQHFKAPVAMSLTPPTNNNNLAVNLDRQILYNHSHSSLYGADVSADHKMMVEAIGRHLVYDAAQATALMCTNVAAYILLTEARAGASINNLQNIFVTRHRDLLLEGRDLGYSGDERLVLKHALDTLGRGLVRRDSNKVVAVSSVGACLELSYYANSLIAHYAAPAIVVTALESIVTQIKDNVISHMELLEASLELCEVMSHEFILCAPCQPLRDKMCDTIDSLLTKGILISAQNDNCIQEELWSRRFASRLEDEEDVERADPALRIKYKLSQTEHAIAERKRLVLTLRPLLEAYAQTCRVLRAGAVKEVVKNTLDSLTELYTRNNMIYGEAVSTDAISNCLRLLRQWGVIEMYTDNRLRKLRICDQYQTDQSLQDVCKNVFKFNMDTPLLSDK